MNIYNINIFKKRCCANMVFRVLFFLLNDSNTIHKQKDISMVTEPIIKCKSNWEPKESHHIVETF